MLISMTGVDIPHLAHEQNMHTQQPSSWKPPPGYQGDPSGDQVHTHHYYQVQAEQPPAKPWYKRKPFLYTLLCLGIFVFIVVIALGIGLVFALKDRDKTEMSEKENFSKEHPPTVEALPTVETFPAPRARSRTSATIAPSTTTPFVMTVTLIETGVSATTEQPKTLTRTVTQSDEEIGAIVSSLLSEFPQFTTGIVTKTVSQQEDEHDGSEASSTKTTVSTSYLDTTSSAEARLSSSLKTASFKESVTSSDFKIELSSTSLTKTQTASSASAQRMSTSTSSPPSLSTGSSLVAVDVNIGPSELQRRLVLWQDMDNFLIARDSAQGATNIYRINDWMNDSDASMAGSGTSLTAASDGDGVIHVFYIGKQNQIIYITQDAAGEWTSRGEFFEVAESSSLSAVWHSSDGNTRALVLAYISLERSLHFYVSSTPDDMDSWTSFSISDMVDLAVGDWADMGLSIASGLQYDTDWQPATGDYCGIFVISEGDEGVEAIECSFEENEIADCYVLTDTFSRYKEEPIPIPSHPTFLTWSRTRPDEGAPPTVYGFMTLDKSTMSLLDHRFVPRVPEPNPTGAATNYHSDMETYEVIGQDVDAVAMTDERVLFVRSGTEIFELELFDGEWKTVREVDTSVDDQ